MDKIRICLILLAWWASETAIFAGDLTPLVGAAAAELTANGQVTRVGFNKAEFVLLPNGADGLRGRIAEAAPNFLVESLFLYRKPAGDGSSWTSEQRLRLFNELCALSSLEGIQYFSASRQTMRTFYKLSFVVADERSEPAVADPVFTELPASAVIFAIQEDLTFGRNRYRYDFTATPSAIQFVQTNLTTMFYGIIPILGTGKLRSAILIMNAGDELVIYAVSGGNTLLLPGLDGKLQDSFSNRAAAVYKWFSAKADRIF